MARKRQGSSRRWLREHRTDPFVAQAQKEGFRARSAYKLIEIDEREQIVRPGMRVVDLGAAPGAWSQYLARKVGPKGSVIALDILEMNPIANVTFLQGDFRDEQVLARLRETVGSAPVDLVVSDMAPNIGGIRAADQAQSMYLAELALELCGYVLGRGGSLVVKVFQGEGIEAYRDALKSAFGNLKTRKPKASRDRSREQYLIAQQFTEVPDLG